MLELTQVEVLEYAAIAHHKRPIGTQLTWYCPPIKRPCVGEIVEVYGCWVQVIAASESDGTRNDFLAGCVVGHIMPLPNTVYPLPFMR